MSNTVRWVAGISGSVVAGVAAVYLGIGALLRTYLVESVELEDDDDGLADEERPCHPFDATPGLGVEASNTSILVPSAGFEPAMTSR